MRLSTAIGLRMRRSPRGRLCELLARHLKPVACFDDCDLPRAAETVARQDVSYCRSWRSNTRYRRGRGEKPMDAGRSPHGLRDRGAKIIITALLLTLPISAGRADDTLVETSHAVVEARDGERLRVVFAPTPPSTASGGGSVWGQPEILFRPAKRSWGWAAASKLFIPVENLEAE